MFKIQAAERGYRPASYPGFRLISDLRLYKRTLSLVQVRAYTSTSVTSSVMVIREESSCSCGRNGRVVYLFFILLKP